MQAGTEALLVNGPKIWKWRSCNAGLSTKATTPVLGAAQVLATPFLLSLPDCVEEPVAGIEPLKVAFGRAQLVLLKLLEKTPCKEFTLRVKLTGVPHAKEESVVMEKGLAF